MFRINEDPAKNIDECVKPGAVSEELWRWSNNVEIFGKILMWIIIVIGVISAFFALEIGFNSFILIVIMYGIYAFVAYLSYSIIALLIASLAAITENTRSTKRLKEYELRKEEGLIQNTDSKDNKDSSLVIKKLDYELKKEEESIQNTDSKDYKDYNPVEKNSEGGWYCRKCGSKNGELSIMCKNCGEYK